jgi:antitoxin (DNA-binding transcriptional repressor) of toxin-antitoxin stability system
MVQTGQTYVSVRTIAIRNLREAETCLTELIEEAADEEEVIIPRSDRASFKIIPIRTVEAIPKFRSAEGLVRMLDNFDEPLEGFEQIITL